MAAPIKITKPVPPGEQPPGLKIQFRDKSQAAFFEFRKIALANFNTDATSLGRQLILDFVREFKEFPHSGRVRRLAVQLNLLGEEKPANPAEKRAKTRGRRA